MIVPLNIIMTYPVNWSKYQVLRDFIQNFYDSLGTTQYKDLFFYEYKDNELSFWVESPGFSYEWLLHIGASTKTEDSKYNAGYFGEGFKIATLCAVRDYGWDVEMESSDWSLTAVITSHVIDRKPVKMLAYDIEKKDPTNISRLTLKNISKEEYALFEGVVDTFYYLKNPILGTPIWESEECAVYTRSNVPVPEGLPFYSKDRNNGAVFCSYQLLGFIPFDLVICLHDYQSRDRERSILYDYEVIGVFKRVATLISPKAAFIVLEKMRRVWNSTPKAKVDLESWFPVVNRLLLNISQNKAVISAFREKYPDLLYVKKTISIRERNKRNQARAWLKQQPKHYTLVQKNFDLLGYPSLEFECERNGGFGIDELPNEQESKCFMVLENLVRECYEAFFDLDMPNPDRRVIRNDSAAYNGMASLSKRHDKKRNNRGLLFRSGVEDIHIKASFLKKEQFYMAASIYTHELCHMFGGDSSESFSLALTLALEILLSKPSLVEKHRLEWNKVFSDEENTYA